METNNKLREALEKISLLSSAPPPHWKPVAVIVEIGKLADAALAEPVKNCEVGTVAEQAERMDMFCDSHGHGFDGQKCYACENCKLISIDRCELAWAQMPYEEGGSK